MSAVGYAPAVGRRLALPFAFTVVVALPLACHGPGSRTPAYPADDRGAYVVHVAPGPAGARTRAALEAAHGDDVLGDDGLVARLTAAERDELATHAEVLAVTPLAPIDRRAMVGSAATGAVEVRIDLFADARADEAAAVAAWIAWKGGTVHWQGPTALTATLPAVAIVAASRLSPVRWVE